MGEQAHSEHSLQLTGKTGRGTAKFLSSQLEAKIPCDDLAQENRGTTELQMFGVSAGHSNLLKNINISFQRLSLPIENLAGIPKKTS